MERFQASLLVAHDVSQFSFRGTLLTWPPYNFTELVPLVNTTGASNFCLKDLRAPKEWEGFAGLLQVVEKSSDGILYQVGGSSFRTC